MTEGKRYGNLDAVRTVSSVMVALMHIMVNGAFEVPENLLFTLISRSGALVEMFFILSAFSMCCGYFEKVRDGTILPEEFFSRRFGKFAPFFWMITFLYAVPMAAESVTAGRGAGRIIEEAFFNISLLFGFLPDNRMDVAGIGWTLGVIFAFYMLFPFFIFMTKDKRKTALAFFVLLAVNGVMIRYYFGTDRFLCGNILYQMCFFALGALLYHFRETVSKTVDAVPVLKWVCIVVGAFISLVVFSKNQFVRNVLYLAGFGLIISGCLGKKDGIMSNALTKRGAGYSFEVYLSHMPVFRAVNAAVKKAVPGRGLCAYAVTAAATLAGAYIFSAVAKKALQKIVGRDL